MVRTRNTGQFGLRLGRFAFIELLCRSVKFADLVAGHWVSGSNNIVFFSR
jgi:hypothetical protein